MKKKLILRPDQIWKNIYVFIKGAVESSYLLTPNFDQISSKTNYNIPENSMGDNVGPNDGGREGEVVIGARDGWVVSGAVDGKLVEGEVDGLVVGVKLGW